MVIIKRCRHELRKKKKIKKIINFKKNKNIILIKNFIHINDIKIILFNNKIKTL
jgi:hypothetical protein